MGITLTLWIVTITGLVAGAVPENAWPPEPFDMRDDGGHVFGVKRGEDGAYNPLITTARNVSGRDVPQTLRPNVSARLLGTQQE